MKTIGFELSKKLNDLGLLDNIDTEYGLYIDANDKKHIVNYKDSLDGKILTLEEAIEFLPKYIGKYHLQINFYGGIFDINYKDCGVSYYPDIEKPTLLLAIEKMITFLINDKILNHKK